MKRIFIPEITVEMFRNGCLESIEELMAEGEIYDIDYSRWIPITDRPMTNEEEKKLCEKWGIEEGILEDWEKRVFTCPLPEDGQEILISVGRYVHEDICSWDDGCCGLENNGDWDGIDAWMPKPEPYKKEGESDADS